MCVSCVSCLCVFVCAVCAVCVVFVCLCVSCELCVSECECECCLCPPPLASDVANTSTLCGLLTFAADKSPSVCAVAAEFAAQCLRNMGSTGEAVPVPTVVDAVAR